MKTLLSHRVVSAKKILKSYGYFIDNLWHVSDIHFICEQKDIPPISDEEAMEVFSLANESFDGELGLSWPVLEKALEVFLQRKKMLQMICEGETSDL